ncbi:MAG: TetR/AcrR family transcriptional regulator [Spirochaetales bacterium]|nr:TetR/AcrR family transcriptional regulator [Spirochaetales bacterium]MCF7938490.1 TetR/AcrR family transcriptional regulator [Spirochaetales bacterium]
MALIETTSVEQDLSTKEKIMKAAEEIFAEKGFDKARVEKIANRADVNKALIYYYFRSKQKILEELINSFVEDSLNLRNRLISVLLPAPKENIEHALMMTYDFINERRDIINVIFMQQLTDSSTNPLFTYMDHTFPFSAPTEYTQNLEDEIKTRISAFYLGIMPIILFVVFNDKWCEYYQVDKGQAKELFLSIYKEMFLEIFLKMIQ